MKTEDMITAGVGVAIVAGVAYYALRPAKRPVLAGLPSGRRAKRCHCKSQRRSR